ncbi:N-acetylglucosamine-6-phosphate deacetylase [Mycoplasma sp. AC1221]
MKIENVKIINYNNIIDCADIYIKDHKIQKIIPNQNQAKYIAVPGFIDTHIHGFYNYDVMEGSDAVSAISKKLAQHGTTAFMPTLMTNQWQNILDVLDDVSKNAKYVARNLGLHLEGPFIANAKKGAHKFEYLKKPTVSDIEQLINASQNTLRKISFDPDVVDIEVFKQMQKHNIIGSIGHSATDFETTSKFFDNGCKSVCHLWNAMSGIDSRNPGLLQAALMNENTYVEMIFDLFHICKQSIWFTIKNKGFDKIIAVSDAIKPAYYKDGENISGDIPVIKDGLKITLKDSNTIAGSGISIHDAFKNLLSINVKSCDAVKMTSYNAAKYLGLNKKLGKIRTGYLADIVLMDYNWNIKSVYIDGKKVN